jgi:hypothetical protein
MKLTPRTVAMPAALAALAVAAPLAAANGPAPAAGEHAPAAGDHVHAPGAGAGRHTPKPKPIAADCGNPAGATVFSQFRDRRHYWLAPDGGFEGGAAGWTLDGASVVDGNESFTVGGAGDSKSLALPAGSTATSPEFCLDKGHPKFRFFARRTSGGRKARLRVFIEYVNGKGHKATRRAGKLRAGEAWKPTKKLAFAVGRARARRSATGQVRLKFKPLGAADWQIDDVYIDPRARR